MTQNQYFRAGVGVVLYNEDKEIYIFERSDLDNVWQFPQGGMDAGETTEDTLWRELEEETGLTEGSILNVTPFPGWLMYEYDDDMRHLLKDPNTLGQIHQWFFLEVKNDTIIDLDKAEHDEFSDYKVTDFDELLSMADPLKGEVYNELANFFADNI